MSLCREPASLVSLLQLWIAWEHHVKNRPAQYIRCLQGPTLPYMWSCCSHPFWCSLHSTMYPVFSSSRSGFNNNSKVFTIFYSFRLRFQYISPSSPSRPRYYIWNYQRCLHFLCSPKTFLPISFRERDEYLGAKPTIPLSDASTTITYLSQYQRTLKLSTVLFLLIVLHVMRQ